MNDEERRRNIKRRAAVDAILREREFQVQRWAELDSGKNVTEWVAVLMIYVGKAAQELALYKGRAYAKESFKKRIVEVGAICVNIIEHL